MIKNIIKLNIQKLIKNKKKVDINNINNIISILLILSKSIIKIKVTTKSKPIITKRSHGKDKWIKKTKTIKLC